MVKGEIFYKPLKGRISFQDFAKSYDTLWTACDWAKWILQQKNNPMHAYKLCQHWICNIERKPANLWDFVGESWLYAMEIASPVEFPYLVGEALESILNRVNILVSPILISSYCFRTTIHRLLTWKCEDMDIWSIMLSWLVLVLRWLDSDSCRLISLYCSLVVTSVQFGVNESICKFHLNYS